MPAEDMHRGIDKIMLLRIFFQQLKSNNTKNENNIANKDSNLEHVELGQKGSQIYTEDIIHHTYSFLKKQFGRNYESRNSR